MDKLLDLIAQIAAPGKTWGYFFRKALSTILVASIGAYAFETYNSAGRSHWEQLPLHDAILKDNKEREVKRYLQILVTQNPALKSVWLYSWPDARSLIPVAHAGNHTNPIPLGYFLRTDSDAVGELVMEQCACVKRINKKLLACPIMTENDAWGVIMFEHKLDQERTDDYKAVYIALAHKLAVIIYNE